MSTQADNSYANDKDRFASMKTAQHLEEDIAIEAATHLTATNNDDYQTYNNYSHYALYNNYNENASNNKYINENDNTEFVTKEMQNINFASSRCAALPRNNTSHIANVDSAGYYARLGVSTTASQQDIRRAFLELSRRYHTDKHACQGEAVQSAMNNRFNELQEAYEVLIDVRQRAVYDAVGKQGLQYLALIPASITSPQNTVNYIQWLEREARLEHDALMLSSACDVNVSLNLEMLEYLIWPFHNIHFNIAKSLTQRSEELQGQTHIIPVSNNEQITEENSERTDLLATNVEAKVSSNTNNANQSDEENKSRQILLSSSTSSLSNEQVEEKTKNTKTTSSVSDKNIAVNAKRNSSTKGNSPTTKNDSLANWSNNAGTLNIKSAYIDETGSMIGAGYWNDQNSLLFVIPIKAENVDNVITTLQKVRHKLHSRAGVTYHDTDINSKNVNNVNSNSIHNNSTSQESSIYSGKEDMQKEDVGDDGGDDELVKNFVNGASSADDVSEREEKTLENEAAMTLRQISQLPPYMIVLYNLRILSNALTPNQMSGQYSFQHYIDSTRQVQFVIKSTQELMSFKTIFKKQETYNNSAVAAVLSSKGVKVKAEYTQKLSELWNMSVQTILWQNDHFLSKLKLTLFRYLSERNVMQVSWVMRFFKTGYANVAFMHMGSGDSTELLSGKDSDNKNFNAENGSEHYRGERKDVHSKQNGNKICTNLHLRSLRGYFVRTLTAPFHWFDNSKNWMTSLSLARGAFNVAAFGVVDSIYCPVTLIRTENEANQNVVNAQANLGKNLTQKSQRHLIERFRLNSAVTCSLLMPTLTISNEIVYNASPKLNYGFAFDSQIFCHVNSHHTYASNSLPLSDWLQNHLTVLHIIRLVYNRNTHKIKIPIVVVGDVNNNNMYLATMWLVLPRLCFTFVKVMYNRRVFAREKREAIYLRREHLAEMDIARERASIEQMALQRSIYQSRTIEEQNKGLIIINAIYGVLEPKYVNESSTSVTAEEFQSAIANDKNSSNMNSEVNSDLNRSHVKLVNLISTAWRKCTTLISRIGKWPFYTNKVISLNSSEMSNSNGAHGNSLEDDIPLTIDVTLALQNLVHDSALTLPPITKSMLVGFCDPDPYTNESKQLKITYRFQRKVHQVIYDDEDEVQIPQEAHLVNSVV